MQRASQQKPEGTNTTAPESEASRAERALIPGRWLVCCVLFCMGAATAALFALQGCEGDPTYEAPKLTYSEKREVCTNRNPYRNAYFGDLHVHTGYSFDAWAYDNRWGPADAYRFAKGQPLKLPPLDAKGNPTREVRLDQPLDFAAVTDHSEFLGEIMVCTEPGSPTYNSNACKNYRKRGSNSTLQFALALTSPEPKRLESVCGKDGKLCLTKLDARWKAVQQAAEAAYDRSAGCTFTSFVGYEYSGTPKISNYHRNVIFRNDKVIKRPLSYFEAPQPYQLWRGLKKQCLDGQPGCDVFTVGHNSNFSNGNLFDLDYFDAKDMKSQREAAALRLRIEPLIEMFQHKGDTECRNGFPGVPDDPFCLFEKQRLPGAEVCGDRPGAGGMRLGGCVSRLDFVRGVLKAGLKEEKRLGVNPYQLGMIGASDTHNATPGLVREDTYPGHIGTVDETPKKRLSEGNLTHDTIINNPGGLVGAWAQENSRDALFNAFQRREVFSTSGPRIKVRFFGGWKYDTALCDKPQDEIVKRGYQVGVPMGATLPKRGESKEPPRFVVMAWKASDAGTYKAGALQQIQIVKGWVDEVGKTHEQVVSVAGTPKNGASVDTKTCQRRGKGAAYLCQVWQDPNFKASQRAFYYARVLENPSCRWTTHQCNALPAAQRTKACSDPNVPKVIQERAWSSPIWFSP